MRDLQTSFPAPDTPVWATSPGGANASAARDDTPTNVEGRVRPFAQVMADLRRGRQEAPIQRQAEGAAPPVQRSQAAATQPPTEQEDPLESAEQGWVEVPLSARMAVITTTEESGDEATLAEFARTQGFDEMALAAIFGQAAASPPLPPVLTLAVGTSPEMSASSLMSVSGMSLEASTLPADVSGVVASGVAGLPPESAVIEHLAAAQAASGAMGQSAAASTLAAAAANPASSGAAPGTTGPAAGAAALQAAGTASSDGTTPAASFIIAFTAAASARALMSRAASTSTSTTPTSIPAATTPDTESALTVKLQSVATPTASGGAGGAGSASSIGLDSMSTLARLGWSALVRDAADPKSGAASTRALDGLPEMQALGSEASTIWPHELSPGRLGQDPSSAGAPARAHEVVQAGEPPSRDASAWADKLAETMGQRLAAQIAKGHWSVRLSLNPQHLGHIDVDLSLRGKDLEAAFQVSNAQTRVLLQDSLPRLKDSLNSSGMDVASLNVSGGWADRDRGNPTPWQKSTPDQGGSAQAEASRTQGTDAAAADTTASARPHQGRGVLDVLV